MLRKFKKFVRKHVDHGKSKREVPSASRLASTSTPDLRSSTTSTSPYNTGPRLMPQQHQVHNGSFSGYRRVGEEPRNGSAIPYSQSLGDVRITNPDPTPASSSESLVATSSNMAHWDPTHINNLITSMQHQRNNPPRSSGGSTVSLSSNLSRTSLLEIAPINDVLTAAAFNASVSDEDRDSHQHEMDTWSTMVQMNPLRLNPPSMPMARPALQPDSPPQLNAQEGVKSAASSLKLPRPASRLDFYQDSPSQSDEQEESRSAAIPVELPRSASRLDFYPKSLEDNGMASKNISAVGQQSSSIEMYPDRPLAEHLQTRIAHWRSTTCPGPLTTAEFPEELPEALQTLGPYARYPDFKRSSSYRYPHDEPFFFSQEDVRRHNRGIKTSANLTRPPIDNYWIRRGSNSNELFIDEPDREIYNRRSVELNHPPISYLHSRYPRHLPTQLMVGFPFPSRGPVSAPPFRARIRHSVVRRYPKNSIRNPRNRRARTREVSQTLNRLRRSRRSQAQEHGSIGATDPSRRPRRYHSFDYHPLRQIARQWDHTIMEESRENSISDASVAQVQELSGAEAQVAPSPRLPDVVAPQQSVRPTMSSPSFSFTPGLDGPVAHQIATSEDSASISTNPLSVSNISLRSSSAANRRDYIRTRMSRAARINSFRRDYQLTVQWLEQNNARRPSQEFINIP